ncbi:MAG: hypothetical protein K6E84_10195 [Lachnospiraceae bacterium]|nr:hypothetical protein [Lachnospiraceae bacterium]
MSESGSGKKTAYLWYVLLVLLTILSLAGAYKTLFFSADIDEAYALSQAQRLLGGDRLLLEMWEPHQFSALLYAPLVWVFELIAGPEGKGLVLMLRGTGLVIQAALAILLYRSLAKEKRSCSALLSAFLYFNFTPKHIQSPEFCGMFFWALTALLLLLRPSSVDDGEKREEKPDEKKAGVLYGILTGLCMSVMVLCYPTALMVFICVFFLLWKKDRKQALTFVATCGVLAVCVLAWMATRGSLATAFSNLPNMLGDSSHKQSLWETLIWHGSNLFAMLRIPAALLVISLSGKAVLDKDGSKKGLFWGVTYLCFGLIMIKQFHGISGKVYYDFLPVLAQLSLLAAVWLFVFGHENVKDGEERRYLKQAWILSLLCLICMMSLSNLPADYSMGIWLPFLLMFFCSAASEFAPADFSIKGKAMDKRVAGAGLLFLVLVLSLQIFAVRLFLVRFSGNQRRNIFEEYYQVNHGPIAGIRLGGDDWQHYDDILHAYVEGISEEDKVLYVGASLYFYSLLRSDQIATGNTISTPVYDEQLLEYYRQFPERLPTALVLDGGYVADYASFMDKEPFASFVSEHFDMENGQTFGSLVVYHAYR